MKGQYVFIKGFGMDVNYLNAQMVPFDKDGLRMDGPE